MKAASNRISCIITEARISMFRGQSDSSKSIIVLIADDFQYTYPFQPTRFCTDRVRKSRIESCFARLESDIVRHRGQEKENFIARKFYGLHIGVERFRILGGARFRILGGGGGQGGPNSQQAHDVDATSLRRIDVITTSCAH